MVYIIEHIYRGDVYYANLTEPYGSEQGGYRPVLIIQNDVGNRYSPTTLIAPLTSNMRKKLLPTHVFINGDDYGLERDSIILLEQARVIDKGRLDCYISSLDDEMMNDVDRALLVSFGLVNAMAAC